jgi:hypothetical protein
MIKQSVVAKLRSNASLKAALTGGMHEGFAPARVQTYPLLTYNLVAAPYADDWGSRLIVALLDVFIHAENPVVANNVDQLVLETLDGASLTVTGQTNLICYRSTDQPGGVSESAEGRKFYQVGGSYEVWTDQSL